ncbi:unnamed protein product [Calicophoron daubneyi]|uniref:Major facilitator superfamily (MFS) profile domain-containing protein n=1 Tax=Calicophoron daubneyi TaxID=300641 RepID=A0AAV2TI60_CALDB
MNFQRSCRDFQSRYVVAITLLCYICLCYMMRVNINVTLLSMVNDTTNGNESTFNNTPVCLQANRRPDQSDEKVTKSSTGTYQWDRPTQGYILGAFFWGYLITQIPGALLALRFGPKLIGLISISGCSLAELCIPMAASMGYQALITVRIIQGLLQGVMMPLGCCFLGRWAPPDERSRFAAFIYSGSQIGTILGQSAAGLLSQTREYQNDDLSVYYKSYWEWAHYLAGTLGLVFVFFWLRLIYDSPLQHPRISQREQHYLRTAIDCIPPQVHRATNDEICGDQDASISVYTIPGPDSPMVETNGVVGAAEPRRSNLTPSICSVPWRKMLASRAVWAIIVSHVTFNWSWYSLITCMPTYLSRVQGFKLSENGFLSSLPYLTQWFTSQLAALASDGLIGRRLLSVTSVRKLNNFVALGGAGAGLLSVGMIGCNRVGAVALLTVTVSLMGFCSSGYCSNPVDLAPRFAGNIMSLTNTLGTFPGIFGPMLIGYITKDSSSLHNWMIIFGVSATLAWFGAITNLFFTNGVMQPWAMSGATDDTNVPDVIQVDAEETKFK